MKVLFISHSSVIYNYREKLRLLSRHKDIELTLLLPRSWPEAGKRVRTSDQPEERDGFRIISAPILFEGRVKRYFFPFFSRYVGQVKPDLIHVEEEPYSLVAWQAAKAAEKLHIPLVFFTWENLLEAFSFPHQSIRRYVLKTASHAVVGNREAGQLLQKAGYPVERISLIPQYGVNPGLFRKKNVSALRKKLGLGSFTVGYLGRVVPEKGLLCLMEAFARLKKPNFNLMVVGGGPMLRELKAKAGALGVAGRVVWVSPLEQNLVPDYLNCMDVLALPSLTTPRWKEQFGRVLIEAQACEVPVVGSDSGAIPEVIGKSGLIFPEGNALKLAQKLDRLARSSDSRKSFGRKGRNTVLRLYTNRKIADEIFGIYRGRPRPRD